MANAKRKLKLTEAVVRALSAEQKEYGVWDTLVEGFHVRVFPTGSKRLYVFYRTKRGESRKRSLGAFPTMKIEETRDQARGFVVAAKAGMDPHGAQDALKAIPTLSAFWEIYWRDHAAVKKSPRSADSDRTLWRKHLVQTFGCKFVDKIEPGEIRRWHAARADLPGAANRSLALLSKMMSFSVQAGYRQTNPCKGIEKFAETARDPCVTAEELALLWRAADDEERDGNTGAARIAKLIMLTGARRGEVLKAKWSEFDLLSELPVWKVPTEHIKGGKRRGITITRNLSLSVKTMLLEWKAQSADQTGLVFPSQRGQTYTRFDIAKPWSRIRKRVGRPDLRLHDLRHVFATLAIGEGHSLAEIGDTLGHRCAITTRRYAHIVGRQKSMVASSVSKIILNGAP